MVTLFLAVSWFVPFLHGRIVTLFSPVVKITRQTTERVIDTFRVVRVIPDLTHENRSLLNRVHELEALSVTNNELRHENETLRNELGFIRANSASQFIPAQVISRTSSVVGQKIIINKGSNAGFNQGMAVVAQGYLVGQISDVNPDSSTVNLITSSSSIVPAILQDSRSVGLVRGGADGLVLEEIPRDVVIKPGESVVTSAIGDVIKTGLPLGSVSVVTGSKSDVFQSARIKSPIDFSRLEIVFGVK